MSGDRRRPLNAISHAIHRRPTAHRTILPASSCRHPRLPNRVAARDGEATSDPYGVTRLLLVTVDHRMRDFR
jgi:hypothetical protein